MRHFLTALTAIVIFAVVLVGSEDKVFQSSDLDQVVLAHFDGGISVTDFSTTRVETGGEIFFVDLDETIHSAALPGIETQIDYQSPDIRPNWFPAASHKSQDEYTQSTRGSPS